MEVYGRVSEPRAGGDAGVDILGSIRSPGGPRWPWVVLPALVCIYCFLAAEHHANVWTGGGQHKRTKRAGGLPQKDFMACLRPCEFQTSSAQRSPRHYRLEFWLMSG